MLVVLDKFASEFKIEWQMVANKSQTTIAKANMTKERLDDIRQKFSQLIT